MPVSSGQFGFVQRLVEAIPDGPSLAVRPGFAFSFALCHFKQGKRKTARVICPLEERLFLADEESMDSLVQAVLMYPLALNRLIGKLKQSGTRLDQQWQTILQHPFFAKATEDRSASLGHLVSNGRP